MHSEQTVSIAEVLLWLHLVTTKVRGLSMRSVLTEGRLITSTGEVSTPDHLAWLRDMQLGASEVVVLDGDHPVEALLLRSDLIDELVAELLSGKTRLTFFETRQGSNEEKLGLAMAARMGISPEQFWALYTQDNDPQRSHYGSKLVQRRLMREAGLSHLFLPFTECSKRERELTKAIVLMQEVSGQSRVLIRVDGEATGDGQAVFPDLSVAEVLKTLERFKSPVLLVEPYCKKHTPISVLACLNDREVIVRGVTDQLMYRKSGEQIHSAGNLLLDGSLDRWHLGARMAQTAKLQAVPFLEELREYGVRGCVSVDLLAFADGSCTITEANLRKTNGSYANDLRMQMRARHGECVTSLSIFKPRRPGINDFRSLQDQLGSLMYDGRKPLGLVPAVTTILPDQCHVGVIAPTLADWQELMREAWQFLDCEGEPPLVIKPQPSEIQAVPVMN